jgi:hypothetical protein
MRFTLLLALLLPLVARADRPATQEMDSPKKALKYFDKVGADPHVDRQTLFYNATNDNERKVAKAFASVDLALAKLRKLANTRFDNAAGDAMVHALRDVTAEDIDNASEDVQGDKATVSGKYFGEPLPMIKVNGAWKIDLNASLTRSKADPDVLIDICEKIVDVIERTEQEVMADKYANASLLERSIKRRVTAILGPE